MKRKAPVRLTGGSGARYENQVAARFLIDLLAGTNSLGSDFARVTRVDWQARDAGWLADDLALICQGAGEEPRSIGLSIKSSQQITAQGFPADFVDIAWGQWIGVGVSRTFRRGSDAITLVAADVSSQVMSDWSALLREIRAATPERIISRLNATSEEGSQASAIQRALVQSFACPARYGHSDDPTESIRLLHDIRVLDFDFGRPTSQHEGRALNDCQSLLTSGDSGEARELWNRLVGIADELRPAGGALDLGALLSKLRGQFLLRDHPDYRADLRALRERTQEALDDIGTHVGTVAHLQRDNERLRIREKLAADRACLLVGESGSGKSALLKEIALADYPSTVWLSRDALDHATATDFEAAMGLRHPLADVLRNGVDRCLVIFDGIEGYSERARSLSAAVIKKLLESDLAHIHVAGTLQYHALEKVGWSLRTLGVPHTMLQATQLGRPDEQEVYRLLASFPDLQWIARRPDLGPLLTNLQVLDWFARIGQLPEAEGKTPIGITTIIDALWAVVSQDVV